MTLKEMEGCVIESRYALHKVLGSGNFGTVYRATELLDGIAVREVALKIFSPEVSLRGNIEGQLRDCAFPARILASDAPLQVKCHFVQVYGWGLFDTPAGRCAYVSMELVRNPVTLQSIADRHKQSGYLPEGQEVMELMGQFFEALAAAHCAGVLHRDIKGANVLLSGDTLRLLDFGMGAESINPDAALMTTVSCYAPESFHGSHTERSDIYQAGLMFYEYWTGVHPFAEAGMHPMKKGVDMAEAELARLRWEYQPGGETKGVQPCARLDAILGRCLRINPQDRYANCRAVLDALRRREGIEESASAALAALEHGDASGAAEICCRAMAQYPTDDSPVQKGDDPFHVQVRQTLSDAYGRLGQGGDRLKAALDAYRLAALKGVYFADIAGHNALVERVGRGLHMRQTGRPQWRGSF